LFWFYFNGQGLKMFQLVPDDQPTTLVRYTHIVYGQSNKWGADTDGGENRRCLRERWEDS
jgi:hypothetical protein